MAKMTAAEKEAEAQRLAASANGQGDTPPDQKSGKKAETKMDFGEIRDILRRGSEIGDLVATMISHLIQIHSLLNQIKGSDLRSPENKERAKILGNQKHSLSRSLDVTLNDLRSELDRLVEDIKRI